MAPVQPAGAAGAALLYPSEQDDTHFDASGYDGAEPEDTADDDRDESQRFEPPTPIARRPRPRPRPRPRLAFVDHPTDKFRPVVPGTQAKKEAT